MYANATLSYLQKEADSVFKSMIFELKWSNGASSNFELYISWLVLICDCSHTLYFAIKRQDFM